MNEEKEIYYGGAVKALGNGIVEGYLVYFTDANMRDLHGEYFQFDTDFMMDKGYHPEHAKFMYQHGMDSAIGARILGNKNLETRVDNIGIWIKEQIDMSNEYNMAIYKLAEEGRLGWSSGALPQVVEVDESGKIKRWAIIDKSLTPTPAMPIKTRVAAKSLSQQTDSPTVSTGHTGDKAIDGAGTDNEAAQPNVQIPTNNTLDTKGHKQMTLEEMLALLKQLEEAMTAFGQDAGASPEEAMQAAEEVTEEMRAMDNEDELKGLTPEAVAEKAFALVQAKLTKQQNAAKAALATFNAKRTDYLKAQPATSHLPAFTGGGNGRVSVGENLKFAHLSASDMALGIQMRLAPFKSQGMPARLDQVVSEDYIRTMVAKMNKHADAMPYGKNAKSATHAELAQKANYHIKSLIPFKANELDASNIAGQGDEWVGEFWSTDLWERERFERHYDRMVQKGMWVQTIERGAETAYFPTEGSDPVAYTSPQAASLDATGRTETTININPFATGRVSITPKEIKIATAHTTILEEDSVINVVQVVNRQLQEAAMETRDKLMVNGDTETGTTNINYDAGTPPTGLQTPYYIASNGFRKTALAAGRDASNVLNLAQYRLTLAELDPELRQYYDRMVFMIDPTTEMASLAIAEIATDDVRRTNATVTSGRLLNIFGIDVVSNGFLPSTDTDGKVTYNGNVSERGTILLAYAPYWGVAYKRQVTLETARDIYSGSNVYVLSMRIGFVPRGSNAAVASYNVATTAS